MKIKAVVWIKQRRIGNLQIQVNCGGDPWILRYFDSRFIVDRPPDDQTLTVFEATEADWADFAKVWATKEPISRETAKHLH